MSSKLLSDQLETSLLRIKLFKAMTTLSSVQQKENSATNRQHELHVSDFTMRETSFCPRSTTIRYLQGEGGRGSSFVQYDGKFREEKWRRLLEEAKLLVDYQMVVQRGRLIGHPDFIVLMGGTKRILELTGHDSQVPEKMRWAREAIKRRQTRLYQALTGYHDPGFVIIENKGNNEFKIERVEWDPMKTGPLLLRVKRVNEALDEIKEGTPKLAVLRSLGRCQKRKCKVCDTIES